jgi:LPXTG-motif cell wall-anchored protein
VWNDDGYWIELDEDGIPLGIWKWDPEEEEWIFDDEIPLGNMPKTDGSQLPAFMLIILGLGMILAGFFLKRRYPNPA